MNNFFLLNEALNSTSIAELEDGIFNLNAVLIKKNKDVDSFLKHHSIWMYHNGYGTVVDFYYSIISKETQRLISIILEVIDDYPDYISNERLFDDTFPNDCNGFLGINFLSTDIADARQVVSVPSFVLFKQNCAGTIDVAQDSIQQFWDRRESLYPNLIFCANVFSQIEHLSTNDDRFKLIKQKLKILDAYVGKWKTGSFDHKNLGLDCSPDTPKRIKDTIPERTFLCNAIGNQIFSLHIKWYFGSEPFRLYFFPQESNHKVHVGYLGGKAGIGF